MEARDVVQVKDEIEEQLVAIVGAGGASARARQLLSRQRERCARESAPPATETTRARSLFLVAHPSISTFGCVFHDSMGRPRARGLHLYVSMCCERWPRRSWAPYFVCRRHRRRRAAEWVGRAFFVRLECVCVSLLPRPRSPARQQEGKERDQRGRENKEKKKGAPVCASLLSGRVRSLSLSLVSRPLNTCVCGSCCVGARGCCAVRMCVCVCVCARGVARAKSGQRARIGTGQKNAPHCLLFCARAPVCRSDTKRKNKAPPVRVCACVPVQKPKVETKKD